MPAVFTTLEQGASPSSFADWMELSALVSLDQVSRTDSIIAMLDLDGPDEILPEVSTGGEPLDFNNENTQDLQEEQDAQEETVSLLRMELARRGRSLDGSYPFTLSEDGYELRLKSTLNEGMQVYLFCLLLSHNQRSEVLDAASCPNLANEVKGRLFQICATLAAAGYVQGAAFSFGFPRPDSTNIYDKLTQMHADFPETILAIRALEDIPEAKLRNEKDGKVDVIAWQSLPTPDPHMMYCLGQAATGKTNWRDKPMRGEVDNFFDIWFEREPTNPCALTLIPFAVEEEWDRRAENVRLGLLLDRYVLPRYVQRAFNLPTELQALIERLNDLPEIAASVTNYVARVQA